MRYELVPNFEGGIGFVIYDDENKEIHRQTRDENNMFMEYSVAKETAENFLKPKPVKKSELFAKFSTDDFSKFAKFSSDISAKYALEIATEVTEETKIKQALVLKISYVPDFEFSKEEEEILKRVFEEYEIGGIL